MNEKALFHKLLINIQAEIESIDQQLSAPVVDGNCWLLARHTYLRLAERDEPSTQVYGHWGDLDGLTKVGWLHLTVVPSHLCGALIYDHERIERHLASLTNIGFTVFKIHVRDFLNERLAYLREQKRNYTFRLAQCE